MEIKNTVRLSVRNLVEFVSRGGDIDARFMSISKATEGTRLHQKIQKSNKKSYSAQNLEYSAEVVIKYDFEYKNINFVIEGRIDGIITSKENCEYETVTIDEIKTTTRPLETIDENYSEVHWAQAKCYGYIYALQNLKDTINIQLTYCDAESEELKIIKVLYNFQDLKEFFYGLIDRYYDWAEMSQHWIDKRDLSIKALTFPFETYRKGQREMAVSVYKTIVEGKKIFIQAPTGIGKTISTLFPAIKAMGEGHVSKVFYLTAKTITRQVAEEAVNKMRKGSLAIKTVTLTAKDKICFNNGSSCNPEQCSFAKGHFDRVNFALQDILKYEEDITREKIEYYARKYNVCPFEFSLDISLWVDCIICDYNYVFDPRVNLRRFFEGSGDFVFLVDEAHNLVDRAREMYSAVINKSVFLKLKKSMKESEPSISKALGKVNTAMVEIRKGLEDKNYKVQENLPEQLYQLLKKVIKTSEEWLAKNENTKEHEELLQLYFDVVAFLRIWEIYDDKFVTYIEDSNGELRIKLFCLHPGQLINEAVKKGKAAIFFSATLMPMNYFKDVLGGDTEDYTIKLPSPFDEKNMCLLVGDNISTRFKHREKSLEQITQYINTFIKSKKGNYMIFFPSYKYMNDVYDRFRELFSDINVIVQEGEMDEGQRDMFLEAFVDNPKETLAAFVVLGGIFSEGIDLKGNRLIGAAIVGVGLPQICVERNIIRDYFDSVNRGGYEYSYMYPGMNKVLQAAGRVIRSSDDRGVVLLLDERFTTFQYKSIFPQHWNSYNIVRNTEVLKENLNNFWNR